MTETRARLSTPHENFFCPIGTDLMLRIREGETPLKSILLGMDRGNFLIIRSPKSPGVEPLLGMGNQINVIFLSEGTIYAFAAQILGHARSPAPLHFLSYPESMERHELRKNLRINCSIPAALHGADGLECKGVIIDLSSGGCRVTVAGDKSCITDQIKMNAAVGLSSEMLGISPGRPIPSVIKNLNQAEKRWQLGLQFDAADPEILARLQDYVNQVLGITS
jgi:c-di-GMP-binding flagellar brake protein YcgR